MINLLIFTESVKRVEEITGRKIPHYSIDLLNREALKEVFKKVSCSLKETTTTTGTMLYKQCHSKVRFIGGRPIMSTKSVSC